MYERVCLPAASSISLRYESCLRPRPLLPPLPLPLPLPFAFPFPFPFSLPPFPSFISSLHTPAPQLLVHVTCSNEIKVRNEGCKRVGAAGQEQRVGAKGGHQGACTSRSRDGRQMGWTPNGLETNVLDTKGLYSGLRRSTAYNYHT